MNTEIENAVEQIKGAVGSFRSDVGNIANRLDELEAKFNRKGLGGGSTTSTGFNAKLAAEAVLSNSQRRIVKPSEVNPEEMAAYAEAYGSYLRRGDATAHDIKAAMSVGSDPDGGYWVPGEMALNILTRLYATSPMRDIAGSVTINSDHYTLPIDTNDAISGGWVGETEERGETDTSELGEQTIYAREQYALPKITQKLIDDSIRDVGTWLEGKIADKLGRVEATSLVSGNGVKQPRGFLDYKDTAVTTDDASRAWGVLQYVPTGAAGGFPKLSGTPGADDPSALNTLIGKLKGIYRKNATWVMNRATAAVLRNLRDNQGRFIWQDGISAGQPATLLGYPVRDDFEDLPDIGSDSFSIAFGDFSRGYLIVDRQGVRVLRDPLTTKGYVKFYTTKRTGGDVVDFDAIKLLKFAAS